MKQSIVERYPEAFEKGEYKTKEILDKASISRKVLDRYKKNYSAFFKSQTKRIGDKGAIYYDPIVMCIAYEIRNLRDKGWENKEIEDSLKETFNISVGNTGNPKEETDGKSNLKTGKPLFNSGEVLEGNKETKGKLKGNDGESEVNLSDHLKEVFDLKLQLKDKDILITEKDGEIKNLQTEVKGLEKNIYLLEAPMGDKKVSSFTKKDILVFIMSASFIFLFATFIWLYSNFQIDIANFF